MNSQISAIAHYTLLEAWRTRLPGLAAVAVILLLVASLFIRELAIIESGRFQAGFYAAAARLTCVFITSLYVVTSIVREFNDKGIDVLLALDLPRSHYILGKLAGFLAVGGLVAVIAGLPLAALAPPAAAAQWTVSLAVELSVVVILALFCILSFGQVMPSASFVLAFYLLARTLTAIRLIAEHPVSGGDALSHQVMRLMVEGLALILPSLDAWTRTAWLLGHPATWSELGGILAEGALYVVLLATAATVDFYRKNL